jgi:hypothetical protein
MRKTVSEFAGLNGEDSAATIPATLLGRAGEVIEWKIRCAAVHESLPGKRPTDVGHSSIRCYGINQPMADRSFGGSDPRSDLAWSRRHLPDDQTS